MLRTASSAPASKDAAAGNLGRDCRWCPFRHDHRGAGAKVHLGLLAGRALHPAERDPAGLLRVAGESLGGLVTVGQSVLAPQILPDPLGRQPLFQLAQNDLAKGLAGTELDGPRSPHRPGRPGLS